MVWQVTLKLNYLTKYRVGDGTQSAQRQQADDQISEMFGINSRAQTSTEKNTYSHNRYRK